MQELGGGDFAAQATEWIDIGCVKLVAKEEHETRFSLNFFIFREVYPGSPALDKCIIFKSKKKLKSSSPGRSPVRQCRGRIELSSE